MEVAPGTKITLYWCPPGKFTMGSPPVEKGRFPNEVQHEVTLTRGFWLGKTEVTQGQWQAVMGSLPCHFKDGPNLPVETVGWDDAQEFCGKLTAKGLLPEGWKFALPTEAQWEYACRAGTTGDYAGDLDGMAWHVGNSGGKTHEVGTKKANAWGLHDMHGNVCEWCADWLGDYPTGATVDPRGPANDPRMVRVVRGGGWFLESQYCRSANREWSAPAYRGNGLGLRVAVVPAGNDRTSAPPIAGVPPGQPRTIMLPPPPSGPDRFFGLIGTSDAVALVEVTEALGPPKPTGPARFHDLIGASDAVVIIEVGEVTGGPPQPSITPRRQIQLPR